MNLENVLQDSLEIVLALDIPDEHLAQAVNDQARLIAGIDSDEFWEDQSEIH
jgi:hypothetical protein